MSAQYVQAWEVKGPLFSGFVYDYETALLRFDAAEGYGTMKMLTIVRHESGAREYLWGSIAYEVRRYREGMR